MKVKCYGYGYAPHAFVAFWSDPVNRLINVIDKVKARSFAAHHDIGSRFLNLFAFKANGKLIKGQRTAGSSWSDMELPINRTGKLNVRIEFTLHSSGVKYLYQEFNRRKDLFLKSDWFCYSYFLNRARKNEMKTLKENICIYYLVVVFVPKKASTMNLKELARKIAMDSNDFKDKLARKSGVDLEEEDLLPVDNIIKVVDLEKRMETKEKVIEAKEKIIEAKEKVIEEQKKVIEEKEKEISKLKALLKKSKK